MTSTPHPESSCPTDDGRDLYQSALHGWIEKLPYNSTSVQRYSTSSEVTFAPVYPKMAPLEPFAKWAQYWEDFKHHQGTIVPPDEDHLEKKDKKDMKNVPFQPDSIPKIVRQQREAWKDLIDGINLMIWTCGGDEWHPDIDTWHALESLLIFRNLLEAPHGLEVEHFNNTGCTIYARLGPCAVLQELKAAIVGSKVCAYYDYQPFDKLQTLLAKYKRVLRATDANPSRTRDPKRMNKRRFDESIEKEGAALMKDVEEKYAKGEALFEELDAIPDDEGDKWDETIKQIHKQMLTADVDLKTAKEKAHWHFQLIHYIKARVDETDIDGIPTPVQQWQSSLTREENEDRDQRSSSPELALPTDWQQQPHVPRTVSELIASVQNLQGFGRKKEDPPRKLRLRDRASSFNDDDDDDNDNASICSNDTVRPESVLSETYQVESSSQAESSRAGSSRLRMNEHNADRVHPRPTTTFPISQMTRTFPIDWTLPVVSDSESSGESEDEGEEEFDMTLGRRFAQTATTVVRVFQRL